MSPTEDYLLSVMQGRPGPIPSFLRLVLSGLSLLYNAGLEVYLLPYRLGIRRRKRLPCPVISIGNLTTGGTGKTPMTQRLCRLLQARGYRVAVLSRGYGGRNEYGCALVSDGETVLLTAQEAGDEAYLLARTLPGVPVLVGKDRRITGRRAWEQFQPDVIVLDDGMQFWQLHRDLDVVLLNASTPFDNGWTLPRGLLREPPSHLRRAGIVVLTNPAQAGAERIQRLQDRLRRLAPGRPVFTADFAPLCLKSPADETERPTAWLQDRRVATLAAIGNPGAFESLIESLGGVLAARFRYRDHQALTPAELERVFAQALAVGVEAVITTEKDAVKLSALPQSPPVYVLTGTLRLASEADLITEVEQALAIKRCSDVPAPMAERR